MATISKIHSSQPIDQMDRFNQMNTRKTSAASGGQSLNSLMKAAMSEDGDGVVIGRPVADPDLSVPGEKLHQHDQLLQKLMDGTPRTKKEIQALLKEIGSGDGPYFKTQAERMDALTYAMANIPGEDASGLKKTVEGALCDLYGAEFVHEDQKWKLAVPTEENGGKIPGLDWLYMYR